MSYKAERVEDVDKRESKEGVLDSKPHPELVDPAVRAREFVQALMGEHLKK